MFPIRPVFWLSLLLVATASVAQGRHGSDELTPSAHRSGPNGLEGWTLEGPIPDQPNDKFPFTLVIARNDSLACVLADIKTGKQLEIYDCFRELPADAPAWVEALEANP